jgi:hypothetical protein
MRIADLPPGFMRRSPTAPLWLAMGEPPASGSCPARECFICSETRHRSARPAEGSPGFTVARSRTAADANASQGPDETGGSATSRRQTASEAGAAVPLRPGGRTVPLPSASTRVADIPLRSCPRPVRRHGRAEHRRRARGTKSIRVNPSGSAAAGRPRAAPREAMPGPRPARSTGRASRGSAHPPARSRSRRGASPAPRGRGC